MNLTSHFHISEANFRPVRGSYQNLSKITLWTICNSVEQESICVLCFQKHVANDFFFVLEVLHLHLYVGTKRRTPVQNQTQLTTASKEDIFYIEEIKEKEISETEGTREEPDILFSLRGCQF